MFSRFSPTKTAPPQEKLFSHVEAGKQLYLGIQFFLTTCSAAQLKLATCSAVES